MRYIKGFKIFEEENLEFGGISELGYDFLRSSCFLFSINKETGLVDAEEVKISSLSLEWLSDEDKENSKKNSDGYPFFGIKFGNVEKSFGFSLTDVYSFEGLGFPLTSKTLSLYSTPIKNLKGLEKTSSEEVYIVSCQELSDLSGLGRVSEMITITDCGELKNLEGLQNSGVKKISVTDCKSIEDLSAISEIGAKIRFRPKSGFDFNAFFPEDYNNSKSLFEKIKECHKKDGDGRSRLKLEDFSAIFTLADPKEFQKSIDENTEWWTEQIYENAEFFKRSGLLEKVKIKGDFEKEIDDLMDLKDLGF